jgi:hypothetical protein
MIRSLKYATASLFFLMLTSHASAIEVFMRPGATDLHVRYADGKCTDLRTNSFGLGIRPNDPKFPNIPSYAGPTCKDGVLEFTFQNTVGADPSYLFLDIFESNDPKLDEFTGGKVKISNIWWTPGKEGQYPITGKTGMFVQGVPETSVWISMILGFGLIGFSLRRRFGNQYDSQNMMMAEMQMADA